MLVLLYITSGLSVYSIKIVTVQYINSANREYCSMFIKDKLMVYIIIYHKGIRASSKAKIIHQYLLCKMGKLFFYYL